MHHMGIGNGASNAETNLGAQMASNGPIGNVTFEIQNTQPALLNASNVIKTIEGKPARVAGYEDREMVDTTQSTIHQPADEGSIVLEASTRRVSALASTTAAPRAPERAKTGLPLELPVEPNEDHTVVLNTMFSPSNLPMIPRDGIYIMEGMGDTTALSISEPHISSTAAECQGLSPVVNLKSVRKRKAPVKLRDDERRKVKREMIEVSRNLLNIPQFDSTEEVIALARPAAISQPEMSISGPTYIAENLGEPSNPEMTVKRLETRKQDQATKESDVGKRETTIGATASLSLARVKLKSSFKKPDGRKSAETTRKRLETRRRNIAERQRLLLYTARLLKQPVETITHRRKSGTSRRASSAPAGHHTLYWARKQDEPASLARKVRASSEVLLNAVKKPRTRCKSAPPPKLVSKKRRNASPKENGTEAWNLIHQQLNSRGRRACTEGATPATSSPRVTQLPNSATTKYRRPARKYKRDVGLRLPKETPPLKRKQTIAVSAQERGHTECDFCNESSFDVDMDISDALDISDGDIPIDGRGLPFDLSEKLERAEKRPRLELIQLKESPAVTEKLKKRTTLVGVQNEEGNDGGETEDLAYDPRYHPSAVSYDAKRKRWMVPASCYRYIIILPYIYFTCTSRLTDLK